MDKVIGFVGLGIMGRPMALNLVKAGYRLLFYNYNPEALAFARELEMECINSLQELACNSEIIITILPDSPQVTEVTLGKDGLIEGIKPGQLYIDMSTIDAATIQLIEQAFHEKGVETIDAPVSGGELAAQQGTLSVMVGGSQVCFERALPLLKVLGKRINLMGSIGSGQITKSCNQIATALATQGVIEALTLARNAGLDPSKVKEALSGGFASSRALEIVGDRLINQNFVAGFKVHLYRKDLRIALKIADDLQMNIPGSDLVAGEMDTLIAQGLGNSDFSQLVAVLETQKI